MLLATTVLWLCAGMAGTITAKYRNAPANVFTLLAIVFGPVWLLVMVLLPARTDQTRTRPRW